MRQANNHLGYEVQVHTESGWKRKKVEAESDVTVFTSRYDADNVLAVAIATYPQNEFRVYPVLGVKR